MVVNIDVTELSLEERYFCIDESDRLGIIALDSNALIFKPYSQLVE